MDIIWNGFLSKNHSWSHVAQNICRELIKKGHRVDLFSTNGTQHFPPDLLPNLKVVLQEGQPVSQGRWHNLVDSKLLPSYDCQLSYTALRNFPNYFKRGNKNRFGIWNYETTVLPTAFAKYADSVDLVLPSSQFSKDIFTSNGMKAEKQVVVPHGIHLDRFQNLGKYPLKTQKKYKVMANIAQPHLRKNIPGLLKAWGKAFIRSDNVCLVLKIAKKSPNPQFDVNFGDIFARFQKEFKNHAEIEIVDTFITDIETLYNAVDVVITMSHCEGFYLPSIEAMAADKIAIAPRYGGQLDFMNDDNSILIDGKMIRADLKMQYWEPSPYASCFDPSTDQCAEKLKNVIANYGDYHKKFSPKMKEMLPNYSWSKVADQILSLCK